MRFNIVLAMVALATLSWADVLPESMRVYPTPQEVRLTEGLEHSTPKTIAIQNQKKFDKDALRALLDTFAIKDKAPFTITWGMDAKLPLEGYTLNLTKDGAAITASSNTGIFYAVQTLKQLLQSKTYQACTINDWPAIPFRGTVEGYYGHPFSAEARKDHFRFYGTIKLNTFIYGPKDDPYHGFSTKWRDPYPEAEAKVLAEMVKVAAENKVNFVWAVHPGRDISWGDDSDIKACIKKFEMMYDLGVRSFAVFFDDIGGEGARAEKQVLLLNTLNREFVRKKGDVTPLIICPTDYNRSWAGPTYLDILGDELDDDISVMWTGNSVCTDIDTEGISYINGRIDRKAYIWWNWPVNDYCRSNLLLGPAYGNSLTIGDELSGFVANPMDKPEASKFGLFGVADYTWNPRAYGDPVRTWKDGIRRLFPNCADAVICFAEHNSDQGRNGHAYRRVESVDVADASERVIRAFNAAQKPARSDIHRLFSAFFSIKHSVDEIKTSAENPRFVAEVANWLEPFQAQGEAGLSVCWAMMQDTLETKKTAINTVLTADTIRRKYSDLQNKTLFPSAVFTGSRHIQPMLDAARDALYRELYLEIAGKEPPAKRTGNLYRFITNVDALTPYQVSRDDQYVKLQPIFETKTLKPGEWAGIALPPGINATWVHFKLENPNAAKQGRIEVSTDAGKNWAPLEKVNVSMEGAELQRALDAQRDKINAARFINISDKPLDITFKLFKLDVPKGATTNLPETMMDGDLDSGYVFKRGEMCEFKVGEMALQKKALPLGTGRFYYSYDGDILFVIAEEDGAIIYEIIR